MIRYSTFIGVVVLALGLALPALAEEAKGKVKSVDGTKNTLVITDAGGKDLTVHMNKDAKVTINDKPAKFTDLQAGDEVDIRFEKKDGQNQCSECHCKRK
jgi:hypothetical protein